LQRKLAGRRAKLAILTTAGEAATPPLLYPR
jgi:hypothetical protein